MSVLIQLMKDFQSQQTDNPSQFKQCVKMLFRSYQNECRNIDDNGRQINFFMKASPKTYRLSTIWRLDLSKSLFLMSVYFYDKDETGFLRAQTERMKIEVSNIIRLINNRISNYNFRIEADSGVLKVEYSISWDHFYNSHNLTSKVRMLMEGLFVYIRKYDELMIFIDPIFDVQQRPSHDQAKARLNRFRFFMENRKKIRPVLQASIGDMLKKKEIFNVPVQQARRVEQLFMENVNSFHMSDFGLKPEDLTENTLKKQISIIEKNESGFTTANVEKGRMNSDKIVMGLLKIEPESQMNDEAKSLSDEGAHSHIYRQKFRYVIVSTINIGTVSHQRQQWVQQAKETRGQLAFKICNSTAETSINSFRNQLSILKYLKDTSSPYIAKYYLMNKDEWTEKDVIYMNAYKHNIHTLLQSNQALSLKNRLVLGYGIAKGLCFLAAKSIVHRDLKPHNILIDSNLNAKIIDFGSSAPFYNCNTLKVFDQRLLYTEGFHIPYEKLSRDYRMKVNRKEYDQHPLFDSYGFGRTICYLFFGSLNPPCPESIAKLPFAQMFGYIVFLVNACLQEDPDDRPTYGEVGSYIGCLSDLIKDVVGPRQTEESRLIQ